MHLALTVWLSHHFLSPGQRLMVASLFQRTMEQEHCSSKRQNCDMPGNIAAVLAMMQAPAKVSFKS